MLESHWCQVWFRQPMSYQSLRGHANNQFIFYNLKWNNNQSNFNSRVIFLYLCFLSDCAEPPEVGSWFPEVVSGARNLRTAIDRTARGRLRPDLYPSSANCRRSEWFVCPSSRRRSSHPLEPVDAIAFDGRNEESGWQNLSEAGSVILEEISLQWQ